ncbi:2-hydroxyglutaryl-CoA dehydratase [Leminorella grimontii]|uniref:2-hydroxyglutaryl-CoA dehydratase n=1 Tax=Leminorella grimontii TaxID=82981 RepID=A0AAV5N3Q4_9GAMM|nr:acyl-CoA dehydratase activase [Leminorella grimontii]KFC92843.1 BadG family benzoyl-CoA reductase subunit [Leminorella grimontii ATCC 33999 = DSM 5078]GKX56726.1 2-hydroxyglutaryl-CoA dehydratase [Leminorella grimontii]VFS62171.1 2-hydroxyglutaryl-CoA dehydratase component A [Leminorella grimontii]
MQQDIFTMGVDIGSSASKCIIMRNGVEIVAKSLASVGAGTSGPEKAIAEVMQQFGGKPADIRWVCATGYGRNSLKEANKEVSELSCHAKGAHYLFPGVKTVIDIGGQDVKALHMDGAGRLINFVMNDKCAAGTGRFLDVMSRVLETRISDLATEGAKSKKRVTISSTCTVFSESEVISHLANSETIPDVINGIHRSVASRIAGLAKRVGVEEPIVMTGGVASNFEVVRYVSEELGAPIMTSPLSQYNGAIGAAIYAFDACSQQLRDGAPLSGMHI